MLCVTSFVASKEIYLGLYGQNSNEKWELKKSSLCSFVYVFELPRPHTLQQTVHFQDPDLMCSSLQWPSISLMLHVYLPNIGVGAVHPVYVTIYIFSLGYSYVLHLQDRNSFTHLLVSSRKMDILMNTRQRNYRHIFYYLWSIPKMTYSKKYDVNLHYFWDKTLYVHSHVLFFEAALWQFLF